MSNTAGIAVIITAAAGGLLAWLWPRMSGGNGGSLFDNVSWAPATPYNPVPEGTVEIGPIEVVNGDWDEWDNNEMSNDIFGSVDGNVFRNPDYPRGIRNNNPGNLVRTGTPWRGKSDRQTDSRFIQFDSPVYGIRAMARVLETYRSEYGLDSVAEIIGRWAPSHENDTGAYARFVANRMGIEPNQYFPATRQNKLALITAIIEYENGSQPYGVATILSGIEAA